MAAVAEYSHSSGNLLVYDRFGAVHFIVLVISSTALIKMVYE